MYIVITLPTLDSCCLLQWSPPLTDTGWHDSWPAVVTVHKARVNTKASFQFPITQPISLHVDL